MKQLIFTGEEPVEILDKSYVTNIQIECQSQADVIALIEDYIGKYWGDFIISRGGNETEYTGYVLESVVVDVAETFVVHFILAQSVSDTNVADEYAEAGRILLGEVE